MATGPIDYSIQAANPMASFGQGYGLARGIQEDQRSLDERASADAAEARARSLASGGATAQQIQAAALQDPRNAAMYQGAMQAASQREQRERQNQALGALFGNPKAGAREYGLAMTQFPALKEQLGKAWEGVAKETQQQRLSVLTPAAAAAQSGDIATSHKLLDRMAKTYAGTPEGEGYAAWADMAKNAPDAFRANAHLMLAAAPGAKEVTEASAQAATERRLTQAQPFELAGKAAGVQETRAKAALTQAQADAEPAAAAARLRKIEADIEGAIIDPGYKMGMLGVARANSDTERAKMQATLDEATAKKAEAVATNIEAGRSAIDAIDITARAISDAKASPGIDSWAGTKYLTKWVPGSDAQILHDRVERVKAGIFLMNTEKMRGLGSLTVAEGAKLSDFVSVLNSSTDPTELRRTLNEAEAIVTRARENAVRKYKLDASPAGADAAAGANTYGKTKSGAPITDQMVAEVMRAVPGSTREEVLAVLGGAPAPAAAPVARPPAPAQPPAQAPRRTPY